jgi:hypothetical protein
MNSNNAIEITNAGVFTNTHQPIRPVLRLAYGTRGSLPQNDNQSGLNRKEKECCNRATD